MFEWLYEIHQYREFTTTISIVIIVGSIALILINKRLLDTLHDKVSDAKLWKSFVVLAIMSVGSSGVFTLIQDTKYSPTLSSANVEKLDIISIFRVFVDDLQYQEKPYKNLIKVDIPYSKTQYHQTVIDITNSASEDNELLRNSRRSIKETFKKSLKNCGNSYNPSKYLKQIEKLSLHELAFINTVFHLQNDTSNTHFWNGLIYKGNTNSKTVFSNYRQINGGNACESVIDILKSLETVKKAKSDNNSDYEYIFKHLNNIKKSNNDDLYSLTIIGDFAHTKLDIEPLKNSVTTFARNNIFNVVRLAIINGRDRTEDNINRIKNTKLVLYDQLIKKGIDFDTLILDNGNATDFISGSSSVFLKNISDHEQNEIVVYLKDKDGRGYDYGDSSQYIAFDLCVDKTNDYAIKLGAKDGCACQLSDDKGNFPYNKFTTVPFISSNSKKFSINKEGLKNCRNKGIFLFISPLGTTTKIRLPIIIRDVKEITWVKISLIAISSLYCFFFSILIGLGFNLHHDVQSDNYTKFFTVLFNISLSFLFFSSMYQLTILDMNWSYLSIREWVLFILVISVNLIVSYSSFLWSYKQ